MLFIYNIKHLKFSNNKKHSECANLRHAQFQEHEQFNQPWNNQGNIAHKAREIPDPNSDQEHHQASVFFV